MKTPEPQELTLAPVDPQPMAVAPTPKDPEGLLRFAVEKGASVDTIERLMAVRRELRAEEAKASYDAAMSAFQAECPVILKSKAVMSGAEKLYSYSPFEQIIAAVKDLIRKHGFNYSLDTDVESKDGWVIAKCRVTHSAGHTETSIAKFPLGAGTRAMSTTQIYAAALTFASRRVFCNAFGIVTAQEDLDGATGQPKPRGPSSIAPTETSTRDAARELWKLLEPVRGKEKNWDAANQFLWDEGLISDTEAAPNLTLERFRKVIEAATKKLTKPK